MTAIRSICSLLMFSSLALPALAEDEREAISFGWWKVEACENYRKIIVPQGCYVFISRHAIAIFRPATELIGDFAVAKIDADAWSHDVRAWTSENDEIYALLQGRTIAKIEVSSAGEDRISLKLLSRDSGRAAKQPKATLTLRRATKDLALQDVQAILGGQEFDLSQAAIAAMKISELD